MENTPPSWLYIHGLDAACIIFGMANCILQKYRKKHPWLDGQALFPELCNGAAMPPVIVMMCGSIFSGLLVYLADHGNAFIIFLAGAAALWALADMSFGVPHARADSTSHSVSH